MKSIPRTLLTGLIALALLFVAPGAHAAIPQDSATPPPLSNAARPPALPGQRVPNSQMSRLIPMGETTDAIWICVGTFDSYTLGKGTRLDSCKGVYLKKYRNGQLLQSIYLTGTGTPANPAAMSMTCLVAIVGTTAAVMTFSVASGWAYVSLATSVYSLPACKA